MIKMVKIEDIIIPDEFAVTTPNECKMERYRNIWNERGGQVKNIKLDSNNVLNDGYIQYLIAKENGLTEVKCNICSKKYTTYVFGQNLHNNTNKEYVWRIPKSEHWKEYTKAIQPDDIIFCYSCDKVAPIIVTRIEKLSNPPVKIKIKRVANQHVIKKVRIGGGVNQI